ncbi:hypothetical protein [Staphylococcus debuckii]|uniref:hypothetical protein n=1 Tax=Staphylococcus debuckii TaxID=2044912 RepID=UPI000F435AE6|nr:hypothetical protein [Staphylococcus debuckii]AYU53968.1 hypothetical protein CNQ82_00340 [Staphylococcus debuckii]
MKKKLNNIDTRNEEALGQRIGSLFVLILFLKKKALESRQPLKLLSGSVLKVQATLNYNNIEV